MKWKLHTSLTLLFIAMAIFYSCKKENSCEGCKAINQPPISIAGPDQVVTLPTDSISLDGSASSDPDGTISEWLWKKISGPASFNLVNATRATSVVRNLGAGIYQFELRVKDNGGLQAKDTLTISVLPVVTPGTNRPPIANAGADQTITLPTNTTGLDGSNSTDPDNNIASYTWSRISGSTSVIITNASLAQTTAVNLLQGVYHFELKVTDAGGLSSKDTMQVIVNNSAPPPPPPPPPPSLCDNSNRTQVNAQRVSAGTMSLGRAGLTAVSTNNKIFFTGSFLTYEGGPGPNYASTRVDIYDIASQTSSIAELSAARFGLATVVAGNKIFFAGGENGDGAFNEVYANVDIYDIATNTWSVAMLSQPRSYVSAATVGNKVIFAGGEINDSQTSNKVDIYDLSTNTWSTTTLSEARAGIAAVTVDNKIYFAGGHITNYWTYLPSNNIDIYDGNNNSWSISSLLEVTGDVTGIAIGNDGKIFIIIGW